MKRKKNKTKNYHHKSYDRIDSFSIFCQMQQYISFISIEDDTSTGNRTTLKHNMVSTEKLIQLYAMQIIFNKKYSRYFVYAKNRKEMKNKCLCGKW